MTINCDIGERGIDNEIDLELMKYIDIANIACGGHAGDHESVAKFKALAKKNKVKIAAHLSYPDKENFGRKSLNISLPLLINSLNDQYKLLSDVGTVKLHGALYNDSWYNQSLSEALTEWFLQQTIKEVICPDNSILARQCREKGILVLSEAFAERRYNFDSQTKLLRLAPRTQENSSIDNCQDALKQIRDIQSGQVLASIDNKNILKEVTLKAQTICIHSDSSIALDLARSFKNA